METKILEITDTRTILEVAEVKKYLRVSSFNTTEDMLISGKLIPGAINLCEQYLNRDILSKRHEWRIHDPQGEYFNLPFAPIKEVEKIDVFYRNNQESRTLVLNQDYLVDPIENPRITILDRYASSRVPIYTITYGTEGIKDATLDMISTGILTLVAILYRERDGRSTRTKRNNFQDWLSRYKNFGFYGTR